MIAFWVTVVLLPLLIVFHVAWYLWSRHYQYERLADECTIRAFQAQSRKDMGLDYIDMSIIQQAYVKTNGACIRTVIFEAAEGSPCIVFVPGTAAYALLYLEFLYALHKQGFHVIGMDPRGHGESSAPRGSFTIDELMEDALEVCRYAKKRFKTPVGLAGSSQGGITTFYAAAKGEVITSAMCHNVADLNGVDNLVLSQFRPPAWLVPFVRWFFKLYQNFGVPLTFYLDFSQQVLKDGENSAHYLKRDPLGVVVYTFKVLRALAKTPIPCPVEEIRTPTMVLQAGLDPIFPTAYIESIYKRLTCEKSYTLLQGLPHLILVNNVPLVIGPVSDWFKKTLAPNRIPVTPAPPVHIQPEPTSGFTRKFLTLASYAIALGYTAKKIITTIGLWFHGVDQWQKLWRPFPDWGQGADLYGALLAAKWNGTRMVWYAMLLLGVTFFVMLYKRYKFLAFLLFQGAAVEALNLFWLANGKYRWGWSTPNTNSAMLESGLWALGLLASGLYLYTKDPVRGDAQAETGSTAETDAPGQ